MAFDETATVWKNGRFIPWAGATLHLASHAVHYGSSVFEGIRCYHTRKGSAVFRLRDHIERLFHSAKIYRMPIPHTQEQIQEACKELLRINRYEEAYIRPLVYRGYGALGVDPTSCPVETAVLAWKWGAYLGKEALEQGVDVCVSSWNRPAPNTLPTMAKAGGNYLNSQLIKMEANQDGYAEGIALTDSGTVSEGSGENLFAVFKNRAYTPLLASSILPGITRDSVIRIMRDLPIDVVEQPVPREMLLIADELFFTGTAAEITPIRSVDRIPVGKGIRGPVTEAVQKRFFGVVSGEADDVHGWLDYL
jgi:branched-chain amino acid aminotransferase